MRSLEAIQSAREALIAETVRCWPWMEAAMRRGMPGGILTHNLEDIIQMVLGGDAQLWTSPDGVMVTYVSNFPRCRIVQVWLLGGDFEQVTSQHEAALIEWSKSIGAALLYVQGRRGWLRKLASRGYKQHQAIVCLELENGSSQPTTLTEPADDGGQGVGRRAATGET